MAMYLDLSAHATVDGQALFGNAPKERKQNKPEDFQIGDHVVVRDGPKENEYITFPAQFSGGESAVVTNVVRWFISGHGWCYGLLLDITGDDIVWDVNWVEKEE